MSAAIKTILTVTNDRGHKVRLQSREGKFDTLYNSSGLVWVYKIKGVSEQEARKVFDDNAPQGT